MARIGEIRAWSGITKGSTASTMLEAHETHTDDRQFVGDVDFDDVGADVVSVYCRCVGGGGDGVKGGGGVLTPLRIPT